MILSDPREAFKCLACESPRLLYNLDSLKMHFATEHGVVNLLSSPATKTVVPPSTFSCHADTCKPTELHSSCLFCGVTGLQEEEMKLHLSSRHGAVFQEEWKLHSSEHCRCMARVQWGWGAELVVDCCTGIQSVRPKLVRRKNLPPPSLTRACDDDKSETEASCLKIAGSRKASQALDPVDEDALKHCKEVEKGGERCRETVESGKERQVLDQAEEEALKGCKGVDKLGGSWEEGVDLECCKEVAVLGSQGSLRLKGDDLEKERLRREILYRAMLEESAEVSKKDIERKLSYSRDFTRALTDMGGKLANRIRRESGAVMKIIQSFEATQRVVLRGPTEMVNKAELMLVELLSSTVEISVSHEEKEVLLRGSGEKKECILNKIRQRISVPVSLLGSRKVVIYGKPEETKEAKEVFDEELELVKKILRSSK